jgi:hypothetical protein
VFNHAGHGGVTDARLLRIPTADGGYLEGYMRGGIFTAT